MKARLTIEIEANDPLRAQIALKEFIGTIFGLAEKVPPVIESWAEMERSGVGQLHLVDPDDDDRIIGEATWREVESDE